MALLGISSYLAHVPEDLGIARQDLSEARAAALAEGREADAPRGRPHSEGRLLRQGVREAFALILAVTRSKAHSEPDRVDELPPLSLPRRSPGCVPTCAGLGVGTNTGRRQSKRQSDSLRGSSSFWASSRWRPRAWQERTLVVRTRQLEQNIEHRKQAERRIRHLAYHDALTDLPNRTLLEDRLAAALAQAHRKSRMLALLYLDLDRFKRVNDTIGHTLGDRVLQSVAERLSAIVREADTVARVGGDEFTILLPEVSRVQDAVDVANRVLEGLKEPLTIEGRDLHTTISMGVAIYPSDAEEAETLLRNAAVAMYRTKERGGDNYQLYTAAMNGAVADPLALESELRRALEREEFVLYYQPQVSIADWQIVGVEALIRWRHPEHGLVLPGSFIPMAEETGLIVSLGEWVLRTACAQAKAWQEAGFPLFVCP